ncbi:uncharacterized protein B0I36DRAFT_367707 [Microdochium trichocladiopsis]|uniref:Uncharacterized protein n=1 Tax=Microdochium trichocladiopsis TaxID=1682393 RepID=A0A9P8XXM9_9PEZI|nr:uncharacterized protein B0I36DRAFT_367707 [Microdochium trichocladiopsis]KAH7021287.1 hypothetical protein B0I36DRAFT_367707 [Microdochium trichocladiopsis]
MNPKNAANPAPLLRVFTTLIRTHHITSRKKLQRVRKAAAQHAVPYVLVRSGGAPGIMYAEAADEASVADWVATVQSLRYKDFQCVQKPAVAQVDVKPIALPDPLASIDRGGGAGFEEVTSTTEFAARMQERGLTGWFKQGMGYG